MLSIVPVEAGRALMPVDGGRCNYIYTDEAGERQQTYSRIFINVVRQPAFSSSDFPFPSLDTATVISPAQLKFQSVENALAQIDQGNSNIVKAYSALLLFAGAGHKHQQSFPDGEQFCGITGNIYIMAVPYIAGLKPDYAGLDFCETARECIVQALFTKETEEHAAG
ncbi:hypothetical protein QWZ08_27825 [Ferruginibacter paludis]|uniref:hypothetical protein n=1 Tax=Ferruginibacter paludis TaxID=1310417 RepID=UPI0025B5CB3B|nr:hypothetical protein [Ferruginibacter paludis]MDN3659486.1 hypothetical protein [Ferruginibacter paludis]